MAAVITPTRRRRKPASGAVLLPRGPRAAGLVAAYLFNEGAGTLVLDALNRHHASLVGATWVPGPDGPMVQAAGASGQYVSIPAAVLARVGNGGDITFVLDWMHADTALGSYFAIVDTASRHLSLFGNGNGTQIYVVIGTGTIADVNIGTDYLTTVKIHRFVVTRRDSTGDVRIYVNGRLAGTPNTASDSFSEEIRLGTNPSTGGATDTLRYNRALVYNRVLTDTEIAADYADPYGLWPVTRRVWGPTAVSAPSVPILVSPVSGSASSPVTFQWTSVEDATGRAVHFRLQVADAGNLGTSNEVDIASLTTAMEYEASPGSWSTLPASGLAAADQGKDVRVTVSVTAGAKEWRVRQEAGEA